MMFFRGFAVFAVLLVLASFVAAQDPGTTTIVTDGDPSDWGGQRNRSDDPVGDAEAGFLDVTGGYSFVNQDALYLMAEFDDPTASVTQFDLEIIADDKVYLFGAWPDQSIPFKADVTTGFENLGNDSDAIFAFGTVLEVRIALDELDNAQNIRPRSLRIMVGVCCETDWRPSDEWQPDAPEVVDAIDAPILAPGEPFICEAPIASSGAIFEPLALDSLAAGYSSEWFVAPAAFNMPQEVIVTPSNEIAVLSIRNRQLASVSEDGEVAVIAGGLSGGYVADVDSEGNYFVHDPPQGLIYSVTPTGQVRQVAQSRDLLTACDSGIAVGPDGNLYVSVSNCEQTVDLYQVRVNGTITRLAEGLPFIISLRTTPDGRLLAGMVNNDIFELSLEDYTLHPIASIPAQFTHAGLAIDDQNRLYVSTGRRDTSGELFRVDENGEVRLIAEIPLNGLSGIEWYAPTGEIIGGQLREGSVLAVSPEGTMRTLVEGNGLVTPFDMAISPCGLMAVSNDEGAMMTLVDADGESSWYFDYITFIPPISHLSYSRDGTLYAAEGAPGFPGRLMKVNAGTNLAQPVATLEFPAGIVLREDGTLLVAETPVGRITHINLDGSTTTLYEGLNFPQVLAEDMDGNIYVITGTGGMPLNDVFNSPIWGDQIIQISPDGGRRTLATITQLGALTIGPDGNLYAAALDKVYRISPSGSVAVIASGLPNRGDGLVFDVEGNLYVSDAFANGIMRISGFPTGTLSGSVTDSDGEPISDAWIQVMATYPEVVGDVFMTDENGHFEIQLAPRQYELYVSAEGFETQHLSTLDFGVGQETDIQITLGATANEDVFIIQTTIACMISSTTNVNLRATPSVNSDIAGQLIAGEQLVADGQTIGDDGIVWWRLATGAWVRSDVVDATDDCEALDTVEA